MSVCLTYEVRVRRMYQLWVICTAYNCITDWLCHLVSFIEDNLLDFHLTCNHITDAASHWLCTFLQQDCFV